MSSDPASAKSTPTKKKPGRKKKVKTPEKSDIPAGNGAEEAAEAATSEGKEKEPRPKPQPQ